MNEDFADSSGLELDEDEAVLLDEMPALAGCGLTRRAFVAGSLGAFALELLETEQALAALVPAADAATATPAPGNLVKVAFKVNGVPKTLELDSRVVLVDLLRERLALTGTKKGCDQGQCGACTVIVDGRRVLSCLTLAGTLESREVTTIEGLARGDELHPLQAAFIEHDAFQCGYCTPGQICSAVAMLDEARRGDVSHVTHNLVAATTDLGDDEIRERMSGNLCRCGAYPGIVAAIRQVHSGRRTRHAWHFAGDEQLARGRREDGVETV